MINHFGEIISFCATFGNINDRKPVDKLTQGVHGMVFADSGYVAKWLADLMAGKNMDQSKLTAFEKIALKKRSLIETVYGQLKNISQIEHTRDRSIVNFAVNLIGGLIAYTQKQKKPTADFKYTRASALAF